MNDYEGKFSENQLLIDTKVSCRHEIKWGYEKFTNIYWKWFIRQEDQIREMHTRISAQPTNR